MMKRSLKRQMTVVFVGVIITILAVMFVTNSNFLEQYYVVYKM